MWFHPRKAPFTIFYYSDELIKLVGSIKKFLVENHKVFIVATCHCLPCFPKLYFLLGIGIVTVITFGFEKDDVSAIRKIMKFR